MGAITNNAETNSGFGGFSLDNGWTIPGGITVSESAGFIAAAGAAAFEAAFAATVPNPITTANNNAAFSALTATNFLGQNTGALSIFEAQFIQSMAAFAPAGGPLDTSSPFGQQNIATATTNLFAAAGQIHSP